ncbi:MAG: hypothetical protein WCC04_16375 [Terriglobales bacterium]
MTRIFQIAVLVLVVAFCFGQMAVAGNVPHNWGVKAIPASHARAQAIHSNATMPNNLYAEWQYFVGTPWAAYSSPTNTDTSDIWPCFGGGTSANPDCPTIGDPTQPFAVNGVVVGAPSYTWGLAFCNANTSTSGYCGQTETWYEDDSTDITDDLTYLITATQVQGGSTKYLVDSGTVDFGTNPYGALGNPGGTIIIYGDQNLGTYGVATGPNNGNCDANFQYPIPGYVSPTATPTGIAYPFVIAAGKTCSAPIATTSPTVGEVTFTATTELGTPKYTKLTTGLDGYGNHCTVAAPCAKVTYTKIHSISQKWTIVLE